MAVPNHSPAPPLSALAVEAILAAGGISDHSANLHVHDDGSHLCISLVGTPNLDGLQGFVMFCDMPM
jgi:hypothetical protein